VRRLSCRIGAFVLLQAGVSPSACRAIQYSGLFFAGGGCGHQRRSSARRFLTGRLTLPIAPRSRPPLLLKPGERSSTAGPGSGRRQALATLPGDPASSRRSAAERGPLGAGSNRTGSGFGGCSRRARRRQPGVPPWRRPRNGRSQRSLLGNRPVPRTWTKARPAGRPIEASQRSLFSTGAPEPVRQPLRFQPRPIHCPVQSIKVSGCRCRQLQIGMQGSCLSSSQHGQRGSQFHAVVGWWLGCPRPPAPAPSHLQSAGNCPPATGSGVATAGAIRWPPATTRG